MKLCLLWLCIRLIEAIHSMTPSDLTCKRRSYRLIIDRSEYIVASNNPVVTIHAAIGLDEKHISPLLTDLWHREINQQLLVLELTSYDKDFTCLLFPSNQTNRFWSTVTDTMNIGQKPDRNDLMIIQHTYGMIQNYFYYSLYPYHQWKKQTTKFHFLDVLFIPYRQLTIFELNQCNQTLCQLLLRIYGYKVDKTIEFSQKLYYSEMIIEKDVSSDVYFRLYFHMLSNILYLIGQQTIYTSDSFGTKLIRIWTGDIPSTESIILNPIIFSDTGSNYGWRTQTFRSSIQMDKPFFFDFSGSLYFNASPPLLIIQVNEQSLVASSHILKNPISGLFFIRQTDMNQLFVFCLLSSSNESLELIGSTLQFEKLGLFFITNMNTSSSSEFRFCIQTSRLTSEPLLTLQKCQLTLHSSSIPRKIHLQLSDCSFKKEDENSTIITSKFPSILVETIINTTFAHGRIFEEMSSYDLHVDQWNMIHIQVC
ncbi:hypothetical protein I4U23_019436 [Adineta vaga]|nr:hypothetical protein I4U23_019436 [Adineta vaga]